MTSGRQANSSTCWNSNMASEIGKYQTEHLVKTMISRWVVFTVTDSLWNCLTACFRSFNFSATGHRNGWPFRNRLLYTILSVDRLTSCEDRISNVPNRLLVIKRIGIKSISIRNKILNPSIQSKSAKDVFMIWIVQFPSAKNKHDQSTGWNHTFRVCFSSVYKPWHELKVTNSRTVDNKIRTAKPLERIKFKGYGGAVASLLPLPPHPVNGEIDRKFHLLGQIECNGFCEPQ